MGFDTVSWGEFLQGFRWRQGEHSAIIKPTGGGKTTLLGATLPYHRAPAVVVFVTKTYDRTFLNQFPASKGWKRIEEWPPPRHVNRVLLWPRPGKSVPETLAIQRKVFRDALDRIFLERGWTCVFDEEHYMCEFLGLSSHIALFHHQGRSSGLTCVDGIQRPKFVPLISYSSATHAFIGQTTDRDDLKRLADLGSRYAKDIIATAPDLDFYEFLYVPARVPKGVPVRTTVDLSAVAA
jgi:hypothetical protein